LQSQAAEKEDYDEADRLNLKMTSIKSLIESKNANIKKFEEDSEGLESRKGDK